MNKPILRYVETTYGCCIAAEPLSAIIRRIGTDNVRRIRNATAQDVAHVKSMSGYVPDGRIVKVGVTS